jgi:hypothetical protein
MGVRGDGQGVGEGVTFFDEDLMAYSATGGIKVYALFFCETFYIAIFLDVLLSTHVALGEHLF